MKNFMRFTCCVAGLLLTLTLSGCGAGYYWQAARGHMALMDARQPVAEVIADESTPDALVDALQATEPMLRFAHDELLLPDNGSYTSYADIGRDAVVWNVFAAAEFSLQPRTWCFLFVGCISYRGYFSEQAARDYAQALAEQGDDVFVGGVTAYSTLGRFADPLLNTMIDRPPEDLAGLVFHELAHQKLYIDDDSQFNESFASFVEREGTRRWLLAGRRDAGICALHVRLARRAAVQDLLADARTQLAEIYSSERPPANKRQAKRGVLANLQARYASLRDTWDGPPDFDGWFAGELNNARLAALSVYDEYVPAFAEILRRADGELADFYAQAAALGELEPEARRAAMDALLAAAGAPGISDRQPGDTCPADLH